MGKRGNDININLSDYSERKRKRKGRWKRRLLLYIFLLSVGFLVGFSYDLEFLKDTVLDKKVAIDKIELENKLLTAKIDSLQSLNFTINEDLKQKLDSVKDLSQSECALYFKNRYEK